MTTKYCPKCEQTKDASEFLRNKARHDGLSSWCKQCQYAKHKETGYHAGRKDYFKDKAAEYRNSESYSETRSQWRKKSNRTSLTSVAGSLVSAAKTRAVRKGLECTITRDWLLPKLESMTCEMTGLPLTLEVNDRYNKSAFRPSLDRHDSSLGYTEDNTRLVCSIYNTAKSDFPLETLIVMAEALTRMTKNKS